MSVHSRDTTRVYEQAGFGGPVGRGVAPALIVVDLQSGFTDTRYSTGADLTGPVEATASLVDVAHERDVPVIYTVIGYTPADLRFLVWLEKAAGLRQLAINTPAVEVDSRLPLGGSDHVLVKKAPSAFFGTSLPAILASHQIDTVIVCGATTSGCVKATVVDAMSSGYRALVPRDCVGDRAEGPHDAALFDIDAKYGDVVTAEDVSRYLKTIHGR